MSSTKNKCMDGSIIWSRDIAIRILLNRRFRQIIIIIIIIIIVVIVIVIIIIIVVRISSTYRTEFRDREYEMFLARREHYKYDATSLKD